MGRVVGRGRRRRLVGGSLVEAWEEGILEGEEGFDTWSCKRWSVEMRGIVGNFVFLQGFPVGISADCRTVEAVDESDWVMKASKKYWHRRKG